ncbi:phage/plasmid primase, P4 family [Ferruginivarius sediminum]|uniref:SF3 helicase domain-containing protein n=1 Tax=Ferruginivarius sediminum TaxID=2661937 RepID=A0A369TEY4_9PROT|nr:phage/plasmid primase, P4 family [Ferruginivarius sediminum]RDD63828.1 hypothetical protein DRB17_01280 [Ferruginivarius sediminum]
MMTDREQPEPTAGPLPEEASEDPFKPIASAETAKVNGSTQPGKSPGRRPSHFEPLSDDTLATTFTERYGDDLRYVATWGRWLEWDGRRWQFDNTYRVFDLARAVCRSARELATTPNETKTVTSAKTVAAVERLARADRKHAATVDVWDSDPWLLNTPGGVVDLRTGEMRDHRRDDHMTKMAAVTPGGDCPTWRKFLNTVTAGDSQLQDYLRRVVGYSLTGSTREHALFFKHGRGANGKSVFLSTVSGIVGDYHVTAPMETFTASHNERHPTELAALRGARMVTAVETEEGRRWAESRIKALTGGDAISARFMRQDFFTFLPQFKLLIAGNHKPQLRNVDDAMRRRFHLVPFTVTIPPDERDDQLTDKLKREWPGILAWAIEGAVEWGMMGLQPPEAVRAATDDYMEAEDALAQWLEDRCHIAPDASALSSALYADWKQWAEAAGEYPGSAKRFAQRLLDRGFERKHTRAGKMFYGLRPEPRDTSEGML